ncbi:MAG: KEOPS complex subunit Pcc1 [Thermoplasmata archaeon]
MKKIKQGKFSVRVSIPLSVDVAIPTLNALQVELNEEAQKEANQRTSVRLEYINNTLILTISSSDLSSLRAGLNSYIRWLNLAIESVKLCSGTPW